MLKTFGWLFAVVFILFGLLGFVPALNPDGMLFGLFQVDTIHNIIHLASGVVVLLAVLSGGIAYIKLYFKVFGMVYALVTILGFVLGGNLIVIMVNTADNFLHLGIALVTLYLGFATKDLGTNSNG